MPTFQVNAAWAAMTEVIPNLYICGVSALNPNTILALNFDLIVNCTKEVPNMNLPPDVDRLKLWLDDTEDTDLASYLHIAVDHIRMTLEVDGRALVHCVAGISRSAAICLAYLVKYESMSLREAYQHLAARRARVRPNLGFWRQLIDFEMEMRNEVSVKIKRTAYDDQELPDVYDNVYDDDDDEEDAGLSFADHSTKSRDVIEETDCNSSQESKDDRKRQRRLSDELSLKRFVPKLETVLESEQ